MAWDSDPTRIVNYERVEHWGDMKTLETRRFYLRRFVLDESEYLIRAAEFDPGGYGYDTSDLFLIDKLQILPHLQLSTEVLHKLGDLPDNIISKTPEWQLLQEYVIRMSREYKIHLQAGEDFIPDAIGRLVEMIRINQFLRENIAAFKCKVVLLDQRNNDRAIIIVYLKLQKKRSEARAMVKKMLVLFQTGFSDLEYCADGCLPIYNYPVTKLISFIQVGTDAKFQLARILGQERFEKLFPKKFNRALLMDEKLEYYL